VEAVHVPKKNRTPAGGINSSKESFLNEEEITEKVERELQRTLSIGRFRGKERVAPLMPRDRKDKGRPRLTRIPDTGTNGGHRNPVKNGELTSPPCSKGRSTDYAGYPKKRPERQCTLAGGEGKGLKNASRGPRGGKGKSGDGVPRKEGTPQSKKDIN